MSSTSVRLGAPVTVAQNNAFERPKGKFSNPTMIDEEQTWAQNVQDVIGDGAKLQPVTSINLDTREGYARSTTGLPYAISGSATVVSSVVGEWLAAYQDPIKAILPTSVHKEAKIIIKRKYVVGGSATIVPERAPARTVALKEDVREVELTRYGADIEMNLNLFLTPDMAKEELDLKLSAQKRELSRKLTDLSYSMLMREGTNIVNAIIRSTPSNSKAAGNYAEQANRIYAQTIFGALNKNPYGIASLLSAARYASAYSCGTARGSVMIIPKGVPDLLRYARKEPMTYSISGGRHSDMKKIDMEMEESYTDNSTGIRILIHYPTPHYGQGAAHPEVKMGGLTKAVWVVTRHHCAEGTDQIPDLLNGGFIKTGGNDTTYYRAVRCVCSSAILAAPGAQTGEMLLGYPFTGVSTSHSEERMRIQLRVYLGAALYQPENVLIMPNCFVESITEQFFFAGGPGLVTKSTLNELAKPNSNFVKRTKVDANRKLAAGAIGDETTTKDILNDLFKNLKSVADTAAKRTEDLDKKVPQLFIRDGAVFDKDGKIKSVNNGEFGILDDPVRYIGLHGAPQPYLDTERATPFAN